MGEAAIIWRERSAGPLTPRQRSALLTTAVLANNAPDLDFVYVGITGGKLGYLLHHRGHTHTLAALPALVLLCLAITAVAFWWRRARSPSDLALPDVARLGAVAAAGGVLHLLMDFGNNYGVHPFWPAYDGWFYGDAIFIIEPWLMILLIAMAGGVSTSRWLRGALLLLLAALLALAWSVAIGGPRLALVLGLFSLPWVLSLWRMNARTRWRLGAASLAVLGLVLLGTRHVARASVRDTLADDPELELIELVSTPLPGNPLCWSLLAVQRSERRYVVREAVASGWPWLSSAARCSFMNDGQTAPLQPTSLEPAASRRLVWGPEFRAPLDELRSLRGGNCVARAFLRFARVPFWLRSDGRFTLVGDLRFDRSSAVEFAELPLAPDAPCPRFEPPWLPPLGAFESIESRR
jgi:inner membrane protein